MIKTRQNIFFSVVLILFGLIFCSISLVNHYNLRTYAWDLGINNNAMFDYAHFRWNDCMLLQPQYNNVLGDHLTLYPILFSPMYWIFGSYSLLIVQILSILFGASGIYFYFIGICPTKPIIARLAMVHFLCIWGIYNALGFDYHDNVIAAMFVPWLFYCIQQNRLKAACLLIVLICIGKENMALWSIFLCLGLLWIYRKDRIKRSLLVAGGLFSSIYFILAIKIIIPHLSNTPGSYHHFNYSALGSDFSEALLTLFKNPIYCLKLLFLNMSNDQQGNGVKLELHEMILLSGGIFFLLRPQFLWMAIPIYAQKLFNNDISKWGVGAHYSIEFVPLLTFAAFSFISRNDKAIKVLSIITIALTLFATISILDNRVAPYYSKERERFYSADHYKTDYNVQSVMNALKMVPDNAPVSASNSLVPHLAFRDFIYQFPDGINSAKYIVLLETENYYPINYTTFKQTVNRLKETGSFRTIYNSDRLLILQRKD